MCLTPNARSGITLGSQSSSGKVFQVLVHLLAHRDRVIPKQELLEQLWPVSTIIEKVPFMGFT
jgi:DNA-binding winged helix-turn-helix (wHTH) protein